MELNPGKIQESRQTPGPERERRGLAKPKPEIEMLVGSREGKHRLANSKPTKDMLIGKSPHPERRHWLATPHCERK